MPYIEQERRVLYDAGIDQLASVLVPVRMGTDRPQAGDLNYVISRLCARFVGPKPRYAYLNEVIGVLECAKLELYRRRVVPYEDKKIEENGDVY